MEIIEIKNNLVRINYDASQDELFLSGFLALKDENQSFIAQIMHLETNLKTAPKGTFAILKLLFNFDSDGVITNYNGSIPNPNSTIKRIETQELLGLLPIKNPVVIGELAQQKTLLNLDETIFKENLLICSEKLGDNNLLTENINAQLTSINKKLVVIDLSGDFEFSQNKITASENFKLPLNYETINFIYEKGLDDAKAESKALIQDVFLEVQDYVKTLEDKFIPFNLFKNVVDEQYQELKLVELVLLKNKLLKYKEAGIFAQEKDEFESLKKALQKPETTVFDLSQVDEIFQREMISYLYSLISQQEKEVYVVVNINNTNSDKKLLKQIFTTKKAYSLIICPYAYKYLTELKQIAKNLILFVPIQQQQDFASYNTFLNKLNPSEFIVYGNATHHLPLIVKQDDLPQRMVEEEIDPIEEIQPIQPKNDLLDEEIKKEVDQFYTAPKAQEIEEEPENDLTEDDLDFIEEFNPNQGESEDFAGLQEEIELEEILEEEEEETLETDFLEELAAQSPPPQSPFKKVVQEVSEKSLTDMIEEDELEELATIDILPVKESSTPIVPIYSADIEPKEGSEPDVFEQGDIVNHAKYGKGTVEKLISYGSKTLCSIHFDNVGRRLLDPTLAELKKI